MSTNLERFQFVDLSRYGQFIHSSLGDVFYLQDDHLLPRKDLMLVDAYSDRDKYIDSALVPRQWNQLQIQHHFLKDLYKPSAASIHTPQAYTHYLSSPYVRFRVQWQDGVDTQTVWMDEHPNKPWQLNMTLSPQNTSTDKHRQNAMTMAYSLFDLTFKKGLVFVASFSGVPMFVACIFSKDKDASMVLPLDKCLDAMEQSIADSSYIISIGQKPDHRYTESLLEAAHSISSRYSMPSPRFIRASYLMEEEYSYSSPPLCRANSGGYFYEY